MHDDTQLTTERLHLREFTVDDWPFVFAYQNDPRYLRYYPWESRSQRDAKSFVQMLVDQRHERPRTKLQLAIVRKERGGVIGNCGIRNNAVNSHEADIGYELAPEQWGYGYASEAAGIIVAYGFEQLQLHRIYAECIADNLASAHVLGKLGFRLEGRLRHKQRFKGRYWDVLVYGLLRDEWRGQLKR